MHETSDWSIQAANLLADTVKLTDALSMGMLVGNVHKGLT